MINYKRLSDLEREDISRMLSQKCSFHNIAKMLDRNVSTISREINAGGCNKYSYRAVKAQNRARRNSSKRKTGKHKLNNEQELWKYIRKKLKKKWSPRQIAEELEKDYPLDMAMRISPEAIYTYIYILPRGSLKKELTATFDALRCAPTQPVSAANATAPDSGSGAGAAVARRAFIRPNSQVT